MKGIPRKLNVEGLVLSFALFHELGRTLSHTEDVNRIGVRELESVFVSSVAVVFVVSMSAGASACDMPLAVMSGSVTCSLQEFADGHFVFIQVLN